jgi:hypothetical protein
MNIDNRLNKLKNIHRADAPAFLFTRIKQQIENLAQAPAPARWRFAFVSVAIVLLLLNMAVLTRSLKIEKKSGVEQVVNSMHLSSSNDLYHE